MTSNFTERDALQAAIKVGATSPCQKSKRGVVLFTRQFGVCSEGRNHPLLDPCDGSAQCRARCSIQCVHAEQDAMLTSALYAYDGHDDCPDTPIEMLHVKVVNGNAVPSGPPSCPQCSKLILRSERIRKIWLLHEHGLCSYDPVEFHGLSLSNAQVPERERSFGMRDGCMRCGRILTVPEENKPYICGFCIRGRRPQ